NQSGFGIDQSTEAPAHQQPLGAVIEWVGRAVITAARGGFTLAVHPISDQTALPWPCSTGIGVSGLVDINKIYPVNGDHIAAQTRGFAGHHVDQDLAIFQFNGAGKNPGAVVRASILAVVTVIELWIGAVGFYPV